MMHKYIKYLIWISNSFFSASLIAFSKIKLLYVLINWDMWIYSNVISVTIVEKDWPIGHGNYC